MSILMETERLVLRQYKIDDAEQAQKICNEPYILKWMPDWESTVDDIKDWINWVQKRYVDTTKDAARIMLAVTLKESGKIIGMVGIGNKKEVDNEIEIAYYISEKFSNNGYISEAAKAMAKWTFKTLKLDYLIAIVEPDNYPSQRIVEKCGFKKLETRMILNSGESEELPFFYYRLYNEEINR